MGTSSIARRAGLIACLGLSPLPLAAHPLSFTETELTLRIDGTFQVEMICDLDALALGAPQDADDAELVAALFALSSDAFDKRVERLRDLFRRRVRVRFDNEPAPFQVSFIDHGTPRATEAVIPTVLGLTVQLSGVVPAGATEAVFFASRSFADVHLTIVDEARDLRVRSILERGARSDPFDLISSVAAPSRIQVMGQYLRLGFVHIVPEGLDHILFVLGLVLLSTQLRPLVWQVTAFSIAHAVTLTLATFGVFSLPATIVEPLIALSIVYVAIENMLTNQLNRWRPVIIFLFGLLHGLGFAGALAKLELPQGERVLGLVTFNVGIEAGQLAVIVAALGSFGWFRAQPWYRTRLVIPVSAAIAATGIVWAANRILATQ